MSRLQQEVSQLKLSLQKSLNEHNSSAIHDILLKLNALPFTSELLESTKIAIAVHDVKKKIINETSKNYKLAKSILSKWKHMFIEEYQRKQTPVHSVANNHESKNDPKELEMRKNAADLVKNSLGISSADDTLSDLLATYIEESVEAIVPYHADNRAYLSKIRCLASNLKRNKELREEVLEGKLDPDHLVHLSLDELATKEQRQERMRTREADMKERVITRSSIYDDIIGRGKVVKRDDDNDVLNEANGLFDNRRREK